MSLVLIVDDQPPIRERLITWISRDGYETAQAADTEAALDGMMARQADVVICDTRISEQGERGFAARLHERFPDTAIIMATRDNEGAPPTGFQPGVVAYLAMPFGCKAVLNAVRLGFQWNRMSMAIRANKAE
jgi:DNA-binding NtrC family response regulator